MASRHIKRLLERQLQNKSESKLVEEDDASEEDEDEQPSSAKPFNPFDLLSDDEGEAPASEEEEEEPVTVAAPAISTAAKNKKGGKAAGKGKKGKGKGTARNADTDLDHVEAEEEDIDALVQQLNLTTVGTVAAQAAEDAPASLAGPSHLLAVDLKNLRGDDELRRIFGAEVISAVDREDVAEAADRRRRGAATRGTAQQQQRRRPMKKALLVAVKDNWPPLEVGGLSMEFVGMVEGRQLFKYVWSSSYHGTQRVFEELQATFDPNQIAGLLQQAPYHLESLLTMYDLYRHMGENAFAEEVLSRALYALEMAWHPSFSIGTAACRLEYEVEENRPLFVALFRHILALSRQGCHSTALECVKFLLALDPEDPMGVLCMVDYFAIRAGRFDYLPRFVAGFEGNRSLGLLPSYAFALALARFREEQEVARPIGVAGPPPGSSSSSSDRAGGSSGTGSCPTPAQCSCDMLVEAILLHPLVLPRLLAKLNEKGVAREKHWTALMQRKLFADATDEGSASLGHLVNLYAERSHLLWKAPDSLEALREAATAAADLADGHKKSGLLTASDWACLRRESFPESEVNEYRHMRLNDYSDAVNALPREEVQEAMAAGGREQVEDVMADAQEEEMLRQQIAAMQQYHQAAVQHQAGGAVPPAMSEEELRQANPVVMMLRTLLPWVNAGQQPEYGTPAADNDDDVDEEIDGDNIGR